MQFYIDIHTVIKEIGQKHLPFLRDLDATIILLFWNYLLYYLHVYFINLLCLNKKCVCVCIYYYIYW